MQADALPARRVASVYPPRPHREVRAALKQLQDCLGDAQDIDVQRRSLAEVATTVHRRGASAETILAIAAVRERIRQREPQAGARWPRRSRSSARAIKGTDFDRLDLLPADFTYRLIDLLLDLLPADFTYRLMDLLLDRAKRPTQHLHRLLEPLSDEYDLVILDCPPSVSPVSESVPQVADTVLSPLIPTVLSVRTLDQLTDFVTTVKKRRPRLLGFSRWSIAACDCTATSSSSCRPSAPTSPPRRTTGQILNPAGAPGGEPIRILGAYGRSVAAAEVGGGHRGVEVAGRDGREFNDD